MKTLIKSASDDAESEHSSEPSQQDLPPALPCVRLQDLLGKEREVMIEHAGAYYRLRLTHANKLILTK